MSNEAFFPRDSPFNPLANSIPCLVVQAVASWSVKPPRGTLVPDKLQVMGSLPELSLNSVLLL